MVMKAIVQDTYGSADVLEVRDIAPPSIGEEDVLVRVAAAGVDRGAWHFMTGQPYLMRILGFGFRAPKIPVPGTNVAGRVEAVGRNVTRFHVGDQVYGTCRGAFAEYARASQDKLASKPNSLTFEQAAVVPYAGFAAWQAVHDRGRVEAGQQVLVVGGSGAVGSFAVQLAKASGAEVTAVCSTRNVEMVRSLVADHVVDYTREDFADGRVRYDRIIDVFGRNSVSRLRRALTSRGRLVIVGGEGDRWIGGIQRQLWATLLSPFVRQTLGTFIVKEHTRYLLQLNPLLDAGQVTPILDRTYPLTETADAVRYLESARNTGRIAITI
jgi:NADPH:quinone reductase-like Zn-dependent oxidoreductase